MTKQNPISGPSQRQLRVGELIRRELAAILARGDHFEPALEGVLISVGEVRTSPDLRVATVYVFPHGGDTESALEALGNIAGRLRKEVTRAVHLKFSPELRFKIDKSYDYADQTQALLNQLPERGEE